MERVLRLTSARVLPDTLRATQARAHDCHARSRLHTFPSRPLICCTTHVHTILCATQHPLSSLSLPNQRRRLSSIIYSRCTAAYTLVAHGSAGMRVCVGDDYRAASLPSLCRLRELRHEAGLFRAVVSRASQPVVSEACTSRFVQYNK